MTRNELEKSLLKLEWYKPKDKEEWVSTTNLYYDIKIVKVVDEHKVFKDEYYVYKIRQGRPDYLASSIECDSLEEAKQLAWKIYVDTIETFFKAY